MRWANSNIIRRLLPYAVIFLFLQTVLRLSLTTRSLSDADLGITDISLVMLKGFWFDLATASFVLIPMAIYHCFLPLKKHGKSLDKYIDTGIRFIFSFIMLFDFVAEHLFWTEFTTRFNFIAVDYLVYTQEVVGNISESYPLYPILAGIGACSGFITWLSARVFPLRPNPRSFKYRVGALAVIASICVAFYAASSTEQSSINGNAEAKELASSGVYNLFNAFWHNEISYDRFYATSNDEEVEKNVRTLLLEEDMEEKFVHSDGKDLTRILPSLKSEQHKNVMLVVMESLSADYMGVFGNKDNITPNLDRLSKKGLFFTNLYATGTRTVRGLEAITLSIPPTPGQSIIRRPNNDNLFSLGFVFKDRGYDTRFIYGGYGYFDNMNEFFSKNGFDIVDRSVMSSAETNFANVWGICDEDMFTRAIKDADESYKNNRPFLNLIMTTSNHRPYTYPEGRIDIPSHTSRYGGVKYADYSVGKLIEDARKKPWFKDTIFIFVADHTAGAGGKAELDPHKYHIPLIFYAPEMIKPQRFENIASQIDVAPMLLGMLNFSYYTKFYGEDLLHDEDEIPHAFISNYQKVALVKNNQLTVLSPKRKIEQYSWPDMNAQSDVDKDRKSDAIAYYQSASWWREQYKRIPTVVK